MSGRTSEKLLLPAGVLLILLAAAATFLLAGAALGLPTARLLSGELLADVPIAGSVAVARAMLATGLAALAVALGAVVVVLLERRRRGRLEGRLERLGRTAAQAGELVSIVNRRGRIEYVNPAVERVTGYARHELLGKRRTPWLPWYESEQVFDDMRAAVVGGGAFEGTVACRRKDGAPFILQERVTALRDGAGRVVRLVSTASDVTREKRLEVRLKFLGAHDPVTGLPNRRRFADELAERLLGRSNVAVAIVDVDRFKIINDLFGASVGDEVLRRVAGLLGAAVGGRDFVARLDSDEFGVIHEDDGRCFDPGGVAERIRKAATGTIFVGGREVIATVTIGIATRPANGHGGDDGSGLLRHASMALSRAKAQGRGAILFYSQDLDERISASYSMERNLVGALRNGEYEVDYQPYCDLSSRRINGAEALLRWRNAELGAVSPALFIPALEESGAIVEVGEWVLRSACRQVQEWKGRNHAVAVAVNLSHAQFRNRDLVSLVSDSLRETGIDPGLLTLELTESICISDMDLTVATLKKLKDVGVALSVDDFGTGYSSLSYIKRLPVDTLKIDQSFVREVSRDPDAASIVSAITGMARSLRLKTIAEGVELEEQRNVLHLLRCDYGQGYLFSPAIPALDFERFCAQPAALPLTAIAGPDEPAATTGSVTLPG